MAQTYVIYAALCAIVGVLGRRRLIGFWGFFLLSLILTPLITLIALAVTIKRTNRKIAGA